MDSKYERPTDTPAAACGRCMWWTQTDAEGNGHCAIWNEARWYKCMVCEEYDMEPYAPGKGAKNG